MLTQTYKFNQAGVDVPVFGFSKGVNGIPSAFEIVSSDVNLTNLTIEEEPPIPGNAFQFLYREDGRGNGNQHRILCPSDKENLIPNDFNVAHQP